MHSSVELLETLSLCSHIRVCVCNYLTNAKPLIGDDEQTTRAQYLTSTGRLLTASGADRSGAERSGVEWSGAKRSGAELS